MYKQFLPLRFIICACFFMFLAVPNVMAITAKDVMDKMSVSERSNYLFGLVDMLSYTALLDGNKTRAECITHQFYNTETMTKRILATLLHYPDKAPEGIIVVLMKKACGQN